MVFVVIGVLPEGLFHQNGVCSDSGLPEGLFHQNGVCSDWGLPEGLFSLERCL